MVVETDGDGDPLKFSIAHNSKLNWTELNRNWNVHQQTYPNQLSHLIIIIIMPIMIILN